MNPTGTATLLKSNLPGFSGDAALYRLDPPLEHHEYGDPEPTKHSLVIASAITMDYDFLEPDKRTETYLFPADAEGKVTSWGELPGSMKGTLSHADALREAGYEVAK